MLIKYKGCNFLRQRLALSLLSGKSLKVSEIRSGEDEPGLKDFEIELIKLVDKITNGTHVDISEAGTRLYFQPGSLLGGSFDFVAPQSRSLAYYLEVLLMIGPFCKEPLIGRLSGITNSLDDPSCDSLKFASQHFLKLFLGTDEGFAIKVNKRGVFPQGQGQVEFSIPCRLKLRPLQSLDGGQVKRVRGISWGVRVSPSITNRMIESARGIINTYVSDVYINSDATKGSSEASPGFGLTLVAETTIGFTYVGEACSNPKLSDLGPSLPEDVGKQAATQLLQSVYQGGCIDGRLQSVCFLFMALCPKDVSKILLGSPTPYASQFLRHLLDFFSVKFKIDDETKTEDEDDELKTGGNKFTFTCIGSGYINLNKRTL